MVIAGESKEQPNTIPEVVMEENVIMDAPAATQGDKDESEVKAAYGSDKTKEAPAATPAAETVRTATAVETLRVGGKDLSTLNDSHFANVRAHFGIPNNFAATEDDVSFANLTSAGGKGGDPMTMSKDRKYFVKELNKADSEALESLSKDLCQHIVE